MTTEVQQMAHDLLHVDGATSAGCPICLRAKVNGEAAADRFRAEAHSDAWAEKARRG